MLYSFFIEVYFDTSKTERIGFYKKFCILVASQVAKRPKI